MRRDDGALARCPNAACPRHRRPGAERFYRYKGMFIASGGREARRFQCRTCGVSFSERTGRDDFRSRRPDVDRALPLLLAAGVSARLSARLLETSRSTVQRRLRALREARADGSSQADGAEVTPSRAGRTG